MLLVLLFAVAGTALSSLTCKNHVGQPVSWYVAWKLPKTAKFHDGFGYLYLDPSQSRLTFAPEPINSRHGHAIFHTVQQYHELKKNPVTGGGYALLNFNDQIPRLDEIFNNTEVAGEFEDFDEFTNATLEMLELVPNAHAKGSLYADSQTIMVQLTSVPKFPVKGNVYNYVKSRARFGQLFMCFTLDYSRQTLEKLGEHLYVNDVKAIDALYEESPQFKIDPASHLGMVMARMSLPIQKTQATFSFQTKPVQAWGGRDTIQFTTFARAKDVKLATFFTEIANRFNCELNYQQWPHNAKLLPPICQSQNQPLELQHIEMMTSAASIHGTPTIYKSIYHDHSKFVIARITRGGIQSYVFCGCDVNHTVSNEKRGGGCICIEHRGLWQQMNDLITDPKKCP